MQWIDAHGLQRLGVDGVFNFLHDMILMYGLGLGN